GRRAVLFAISGSDLASALGPQATATCTPERLDEGELLPRRTCATVGAPCHAGPDASRNATRGSAGSVTTNLLLAKPRSDGRWIRWPCGGASTMFRSLSRSPRGDRLIWRPIRPVYPGLENRYGRLRPSRVRIPPSPLTRRGSTTGANARQPWSFGN